MMREEFLKKLKEALENDLSGRIIEENVNYYESYIIEETRKGRAESEVVGELGDPWILARSIVDMAEGERTAKETCEGSDGYHSRRERRESQRGRKKAASGNSRMYSMGSWWKSLLLILGILGIFLIVLAVIGGIFSLLMPVLVPVFCVVLIFRLIGSRR